MALGYKNVGIRKYEFVAKTQFLSRESKNRPTKWLSKIKSQKGLLKKTKLNQNHFILRNNLQRI